MEKHQIFKLGFFIALVLFFNSCSKEITEETAIENDDQTQTYYSTEPKSIEQLCEEYFSEDEAEVANTIITRTNQFFEINNGKEEFEDKEPCHIEPIYAYGIEGVAYYEIWFTSDNSIKGWLLLSATDNDYPIVTFSHEGTPYSMKVKENIFSTKSTDDNNKIYRFGLSYFSMENENGDLVSEYGAMPEIIILETGLSFGEKLTSESVKSADAEEYEFVEGKDYIAINDYETLKSAFAENYYTDSRKSATLRMKAELDNPASLKAYWIYRWVSGSRCYYLQIPANYLYNYTDCYSGCVNNAWTNIFGWWDKNQSKSTLIPTTSTGETCPTYNNTIARRVSVDPVQMYCHGVCGTYCSGTSGATKLKNVYKGYKYVNYKGYGWSYWYQWCSSKGCDVDLANVLTDCIANNYRPALVGANSHAYMGYGWAQWSSNTNRTWVYCYPGWQTNDDDNLWIHWEDLNCSVKLIVN